MVKKIEISGKNNPKIKSYSNIRLFFRNTAYLIRYSIYYIIGFITLIIKIKKAKKLIRLKSYHDTRFINFFFNSLKKDWRFSLKLDFNTPLLIKKVGIIDFFKYFYIELFSFQPENPVVVYDENEVHLKNNEINFLTNYFKYFIEDEVIERDKRIYMPYYKYPKGSKKTVITTKDANIRIVFSGSTNSLWYDKFSWQHQSGKKMLTRNQIINFIIKHFKKNVLIIKKFRDLSFKTQNTKIILSINDRLISKKKTILSSYEHLKLISNSSFFLTAPGTEMPICHHLIESIKYNTIPITSYGDLIYPKLSEQNSLSFQNYDDLYNAIDLAMNMSEEKINELRKNLKKYYDNFLSEQSFRNKFNNSTFPISIIANNDHESVNLFKKNLNNFKKII